MNYPSNMIWAAALEAAAEMYNDPALAIDWQIPADKVLLSAKDSKNPLLEAAEIFDCNDPEYLQ